MTRSLARVVVVAGLLGAVAAPALAEQGPWGTPDETKPCQAFDSPECKAEINKRAQKCVNDPRENVDNRTWKEQGFKSQEAKDARHKEFCTEVATDILKRQMAELEEQRKSAVEDKAKLEAVELPKPELRNAGLEKAVAAAYAKGYPGGKILKIILGSWSDDFEKDAFGRVTGRDIDATVVIKQPDGSCLMHDELWMQRGNGKSFSGPLSARGAGSMKETEILCSKAEAGATASATTSKKKSK